MKIVAVGHRGTGIGVPENSIVSHEKAYALGARGIEFDIRTTRDHEFIVFHDKTVHRMTNGKGKVSDMTLAEIKALNLTHKGHVTKHKIPTLREALRNVRGRFMIDLHYKGGFDGAANALKTILQEEGFAEHTAPLVTIFCRDRTTIASLMELNVLYAVRPLYRSKAHARAMAARGIKAMGLRNHQLTTERAACICDPGMALFFNAMKYSAWNIFRELIGFPLERQRPKDEDLLHYYDAAITRGALFIQTDYLKELVRLLKANNCYEDRVLNRHFNPIIPPGNIDPSA